MAYMARNAGTDQDLLAMALVGYEAEKAKIDTAISEIQAQLGHGVKAATDGVAPVGRGNRHGRKVYWNYSDLQSGDTLHHYS